MADWFNFLDLRHYEIGFGRGKLANSFRLIHGVPRVRLPPFLEEIVFEYNNFASDGIAVKDRYGVCLFKRGNFDYLLLANSDKIDSYRLYGLEDASLLGLDRVWSYIFSDFKDFYDYRESMLFAYKVYKEKERLFDILPEGVDSLVDVIKI